MGPVASPALGIARVEEVGLAIRPVEAVAETDGHLNAAGVA
jgi:hypothetical protein